MARTRAPSQTPRGDDYFREQEGQQARTSRAEWLADRLAAYRPHRSSKSLRLWQNCSRTAPARYSRSVLISLSQLDQAYRFLGHDRNIALLLGRGETSMPSADHLLDMVVTSAVILHNPPEVAERIRREVMRVSRRFAAHNEAGLSLSYIIPAYKTPPYFIEPGLTSPSHARDPDGSGPVGLHRCLLRIEPPA